MSSFDSLTLALEGWFDKRLCDLPDALRQRVEREFFPLPWDKMSAEGRQGIASQSDYLADPATTDERKFSWDFADRMLVIEAQISEWEAVVTTTAGDLALKETRLAKLQKELARMEAQVRQTCGDNFPLNIQQEADLGTPEWRSRNARAAANALHDQPGGSRAKKKRIREIWASGKYSSRNICAEQECAELNMSFSVARKALVNEPAP